MPEEVRPRDGTVPLRLTRIPGRPGIRHPATTTAGTRAASPTSIRSIRFAAGTEERSEDRESNEVRGPVPRSNPGTTRVSIIDSRRGCQVRHRRELVRSSHVSPGAAACSTRRKTEGERKKERGRSGISIARAGRGCAEGGGVFPAGRRRLDARCRVLRGKSIRREPATLLQPPASRVQ